MSKSLDALHEHTLQKAHRFPGSNHHVQLKLHVVRPVA